MPTIVDLPRPSKELVATYATLPTTNISDALDRCGVVVMG